MSRFVFKVNGMVSAQKPEGNQREEAYKYASWCRKWTDLVALA